MHLWEQPPFDVEAHSSMSATTTGNDGHVDDRERDTPLTFALAVFVVKFESSLACDWLLVRIHADV